MALTVKGVDKPRLPDLVQLECDGSFLGKKRPSTSSDRQFLAALKMFQYLQKESTLLRNGKIQEFYIDRPCRFNDIESALRLKIKCHLMVYDTRRFPGNDTPSVYIYGTPHRDEEAFTEQLHQSYEEAGIKRTIFFDNESSELEMECSSRVRYPNPMRMLARNTRETYDRAFEMYAGHQEHTDAEINAVNGVLADAVLRQSFFEHAGLFPHIKEHSGSSYVVRIREAISPDINHLLDKIPSEERKKYVLPNLMGLLRKERVNHIIFVPRWYAIDSMKSLRR